MTVVVAMRRARKKACEEYEQDVGLGRVVGLAPVRKSLRGWV